MFSISFHCGFTKRMLTKFLDKRTDRDERTWRRASKWLKGQTSEPKYVQHRPYVQMIPYVERWHKPSLSFGEVNRKYDRHRQIRLPSEFPFGTLIEKTKNTNEWLPFPRELNWTQPTRTMTGNGMSNSYDNL